MHRSSERVSGLVGLADITLWSLLTGSVAFNDIQHYRASSKQVTRVQCYKPKTKKTSWTGHMLVKPSQITTHSFIHSHLHVQFKVATIPTEWEATYQHAPLYWLVYYFRCTEHPCFRHTKNTVSSSFLYIALLHHNFTGLKPYFCSQIFFSTTLYKIHAVAHHPSVVVTAQLIIII